MKLWSIARRALALAAACMLCLSSARAEGAPVPLLAFAAGDGREVDLSRTAELHVAVNHCLYGEPMQIVTDESVIKRAAEAVSAMTVNGLHDRIASTGTYFVFSFCDEGGESLFHASFQDGLLMLGEGRYDVSGLEALTSVEGIMLAKEWDDYWARADEAEREYLEKLSVRFPASIFEVRGYEASRLRREDVLGVEIYVSWNEAAGRLSTSDADMIGRVYDALQCVRATGSAPEDGDGLTYFVTLYYADSTVGASRSV